MIEVLSQGSLVIASPLSLPNMNSRGMPIAPRHRIVISFSALVQLPVAAGFDRRSKPDQCRFLEMAAHHHQPDRQAVDTSAWHGEGRMPRYVEGTGVRLHVECGIDRATQRCIGRR